MKKGLTAFLLAIIIVCTLLPSPAFAANFVDSGMCGDNLTWTLDSSGKVTISGTGDMYNYDRVFDDDSTNLAPWGGGIFSVVINEGVTSIGDYAFSDQFGLTNVKIPNSVRSIGKGAFNCCECLSAITIPNNVTTIGDSAFYNTSLEIISIPKSVTSIGNQVFSFCRELTKINVQSGNPCYISYNGALFNKNLTELICCPCQNTSFLIPDSVTSIKDSAFDSCSLKSLTIPDSVTSIGDYAFHNCNLLTSVTISNNINSIGERVFCECESLASIIIPNGVTSIGNYAFSSCDSLVSAAIPDSVIRIGVGAFECYALKDVYYSGSEKQWNAINVEEYNDNLNNATIHYSSDLDHTHNFTTAVEMPSCTEMGSTTYTCTKCGYSYVENQYPLGHDIVHHSGKAPTDTQFGWESYDTCTRCDYSTYKEIPALNIIASGDCGKDGNNVTWTLSREGTLTISGAGEMRNYYMGIDMPPWYSKSDDIIEAIIGNGVTSIGESAFYSCDNLTNVTISNSITSIGPYAFYGCSNLSDVTIPNSVRMISSDAFGGCVNLTNLTIPNSVTSIGSYAFSNCDKLTNVTIPESISVIGTGAFSGCDKLANVTIPEGVKNIGEEMFRDCGALAKLSIPYSITSIKNSAFRNCNCLTDIYYGGSEKQWAAISIEEHNEALKTAKVYYNQHQHKYTDIVTNPTCTEWGYTTHVCACGNSYIDSYVKATGHSFFEWKVSTYPTCTTVGIETRTCHCGMAETRAIKAQGHVWDNGVCTVCGSADSPFVDVNGFIPTFKKSIVWAYKNNITAGIDDTHFNPQGLCTRAHVVTFLWRAAGCPAPKSMTSHFSDVNWGTYYYKAVMWASEEGIVAGYNDGTFRPGDTCSRAQVVTFLWRYMGRPTSSSWNPFVDLDKNAYYNAIVWAYNNGVASGVDSTHFSPYDTCTRAQITTFLYRCISSRMTEIRNILEITNAYCSKPDSAGGVDYYIGFTNNSDKVIKYITFSVLPYNSVGDIVTCDIRDYSEFRGYATGPYAKGEGYSAYYPARWDKVWYNWTITEIQIIKVEIEYTDGSIVTLTGHDLGYTKTY